MTHNTKRNKKPISKDTKSGGYVYEVDPSSPKNQQFNFLPTLHNAADAKKHNIFLWNMNAPKSPLQESRWDDKVWKQFQINSVLYRSIDIS